MILNVKVNMPKDKKILEDKAAETLATILVNKLQQKEIDYLIDLLQDPNTDIKI